MQLIEERQREANERRIAAPLARYASELRRALVHKEMELSSRTNDLRMAMGQGMPRPVTVYSTLGRLRTYFTTGSDMRSPQSLTSVVSPESLADAGLVYNPGSGAAESDRCTCVYCGAHFGDWTRQLQSAAQTSPALMSAASGAVTPSDLHRLRSPSCPYITGVAKDIPVASFQSTPRIVRVGRRWLIEHYTGPCTITVPSSDSSADIHVFMCRGTEENGGYVRIKTDGSVRSVFIGE